MELLMATLHVQSRERANSAEVRRLRKKGILPMALIVKGKGTRLVQATASEVRSTIRSAGGVAVFGLDVDGESRQMNVVIKDVQRDVISRAVVHLTLQEVKEDDIIKMQVPVIIEGEPEAVKQRESTLLVPLVMIEVQAKPGDIPASITLDVSGMGPNDKIVIGDVEFPEGVVSIHPDDAVIVTTAPAKVVSLEVPVAEGEEAVVEEEVAEGEELAEGEEAAEGEATEEGAEGAEPKASEEKKN